MVRRVWVIALFVFLPMSVRSALAAPPAKSARSEAARKAASTQGFTLEQALDFPYPEETSISSCSTRDRIAWVENVHGVRNVVVAEAPQWKKRQITHYIKDDGQTKTELQFTFISSVFFFCGGGP